MKRIRVLDLVVMLAVMASCLLLIIWQSSQNASGQCRERTAECTERNE